MRAIAFTNTGGDNPAAGVRTIEWTLDDGDGSLNGGSSTGTFTSSVTVTGINDAPSGTSATIQIDEDETYVFGASDFGFSDIDGNALMAVQVTTLPGLGTLYYDADGAGGVDPVTFSAGTAFTLAMLDAGQLFYVPEADASGSGHASFAFQVRCTYRGQTPFDEKVQLAAGGTRTIGPFAIGTSCVVSETGSGGATSTALAPADGTVVVPAPESMQATPSFASSGVITESALA